MRLRRALTGTLAALSLTFAGTSAATAEPVEPEPVTGEVFYGGTTQSTDPTRWDYVPEDFSSTPGISPMSAWGQQWIGGFSVKGFGIPRFILTHDIQGSGTRITRESAYAMSATGQVCNYRIDFQNRSSVNNSIFSTVIGSHHSGCSPIGTVGGNNARAPYNVRLGKQCARFYSQGVYIGEQCHRIE